MSRSFHLLSPARLRPLLPQPGLPVFPGYTGKQEYRDMLLNLHSPGGMVGGRAVFTPTSIQNLLRVWMDPTSTYINNGTITEGGTISQVEDRGNLNTSWGQAGGTLRPTWSATSMNTKPGITFDGSNDFLSSTDDFLQGEASGCIVMALKVNSTVFGAGYHFFGDSVGTDIFRTYAATNTTVATDAYLNGATRTASGSYTWVNGTIAIVEADYQSGTGNLRILINGNVIATFSTTGSFPTASSEWRFGITGSVTQPFNGTVGHTFAAFNLSDANRRNLRIWLGNLYGVTVGTGN